LHGEKYSQQPVKGDGKREKTKRAWQARDGRYEKRRKTGKCGLSLLSSHSMRMHTVMKRLPYDG